MCFFVEYISNYLHDCRMVCSLTYYFLYFCWSSSLFCSFCLHSSTVLWCRFLFLVIRPFCGDVPQLAFFINLQWAIILLLWGRNHQAFFINLWWAIIYNYPDGPIRPTIDLCRMLTGVAFPVYPHTYFISCIALK